MLMLSLLKICTQKTKITIVGSKIDTKYYQDVSPWKMEDEIVKVVEDNDHLGQVVSGTDQVKILIILISNSLK